jgi:hypothetical protein
MMLSPASDLKVFGDLTGRKRRQFKSGCIKKGADIFAPTHAVENLQHEIWKCCQMFPDKLVQN